MSFEIDGSTLKNAKITFVLIGINSLLYIILNLILGGDAVYVLAQDNYAIAHGTKIWMLFTSIFVHANLSHIFFNMLSLFIFGALCEKLYSRRQYLLIYFTAGIIGSIFSFIYYLIAYAPFNIAVFGLGSSGAIYGLMGATFLKTPRQNLFLYIYAILFLVSRIFLSLDNWAHLFGLGAGIGVAFFIKRYELRQYYKYANHASLSSVSYTQKKKRFSIRPIFKKKDKSPASLQATDQYRPSKKTYEQQLLDRFCIILQTEVSIQFTEMATYLKLSEEDLHRRILVWNKKLPIEFDADFIRIPNMNAFLRALELL